jgi:hypothetical protein
VPRKTTLFLATLVLSLTASAATMLPLNAVGINEKIVVTNTGRIPVINGGLFTGTIAGYAADFWCVDVENYIHPTQTYQGNVTLLGAWPGGTNPQVQKGTATGNAWIYQGPPNLSPLQRYQAAAYLITQMQAYQAGIDTSSDDPYQLAIWSLLDLAPGDNVTETPQALTYRANAIAYILSHPSFGFGSWAVVSGKVNSQGALQCDRVQTFLTPVAAQVPEPATYAMMGAGLLGLALIWRRKQA